MTSSEHLARLTAQHPDWVIRREAGQDWTCWTAQRVQVITAPSLAELEPKLTAATAGPAGPDPRVTAARELLGEQHEPLTMTPGDLRQLLARYQRRLRELLEGQGRRPGLADRRFRPRTDQDERLVRLRPGGALPCSGDHHALSPPVRCM